MARVSICVTTFNQHRYIRECLQSLIAQAMDCDAEILVGDDCSDDGTSEIVAELAAAHPTLVTHIRHAPRLGSPANTKDLLGRCAGEYVARLDGDDYWLPGKLERQLEYLDAHPGCSAVYTNAITIDEAGNRIGVFNDVGDGRFDLAALLRRGNFLNNSSVLFRRQSIEPWLAIDEALIDYRAHLLHATFGYVAQIGEPLTAYRVSAQGSIVAGMNERVRRLYWDAIRSVPRELVSDGDYARGISDFMRRVCLRALSTRSGALVREWWPQVREASPYGSLRTVALVLGSMLRITAKTLAGRFRRGPDGRRLRVLYRR
jgi:glycosyltransferase involved in cell wall biosynthesis